MQSAAARPKRVLDRLWHEEAACRRCEAHHSLSRQSRPKKVAERGSNRKRVADPAGPTTSNVEDRASLGSRGRAHTLTASRTRSNAICWTRPSVGGLPGLAG